MHTRIERILNDERSETGPGHSAASLPFGMKRRRRKSIQTGDGCAARTTIPGLLTEKGIVAMILRVFSAGAACLLRFRQDVRWLPIPLAALVLAVALLAAAPVAIASDTAAGGDPSGAFRPVAVIGRGELERSGLQSLGDLFGDRTAYNAFGLYRAYSLGTILIDGRRAEGLSTLPLSAVERIEIFAPGASAFETVGAGAGTANILLRRDFEGAEVRASGALPAAKGGDSGHIAALWGGKVGRAHVTFGAEGLRRGEVRWADRDFSRGAWTEGGAFADASGVSVFGNTLFIETDDGTVARPLGACTGNGYTGVLANPGGKPGTGCGYSYGDVGWETPRRERQGVFAGLDLPFGKAATVYAGARFVQEDTLKRWAPTAGVFEISSSKLRPEDLGVEPTSDKISVYHRFVGHGNRVWDSRILEHDLILGLRGRLAAGLGYDLSLRSYRWARDERGSTFVSENRIQEAVENGRYDLENPLSPMQDHREAVRETSLRSLHNGLYRRSAARAALDGTAFALPGGPVRWTVGAELGWLEESSRTVFRDSAAEIRDDPLNMSVTVYDGERRTGSLFTGIELPVHRDWTVALAARRDDHGDVGAAWSYRIASEWRPHRALTLRGSWATAHRPPGIGDLRREGELDFPHVCDTKEYTGPLAECDSLQIQTERTGNPDLGPDKSQAWSLGATARLGVLTLGADWFRIETSDAPGRMSPQTLVDLAAQGRPLPAGAAVIRQAGRIAKIVNPLVNTADSIVAGIDLRADAGWKTGPFDTGIALRWLHMTESETRVGGSVLPGDFPRNRVEASLRAGRNGLTASWTVRAISGFANSDGSGRYAAWVGHDLLLHWRDAFGLKGFVLGGGVLNVADRGPSVDTADPEAADVRLDSIRGRTVFFSIGAEF